MNIQAIRKLIIVSALSIGGAFGCAAPGGKTQKQAATEQWNHARATVLCSLAHDQYASGSFDKSRQTVDSATALDPKNIELVLLSARIDIELGQLESAQAELAKAATLDPKNAEIDYLTGVVQQRWQRPDKAREAYARAVEKKSDDVAYLMAEAEMYVQLDDAPAALSLLQDRVVFYEHSAAIRDAIGQLLEQSGNLTRALEYYRQASALDGTDQDIRERLALALFRNGDYREALSQLSRVLAAPESAKRSDLQIAAGECELQLNLPSDARHRFDDLTTADDTNAAAWLGVAKASLNLGDLRRAEQAAMRATALLPGSASAHELLGYVRMRQARFDEAAVSFRRAMAADRADATNVCMLGMALTKQGRAAEAKAYFAQALAIDPKNELALRLTATMTASAND